MENRLIRLSSKAFWIAVAIAAALPCLTWAKGNLEITPVGGKPGVSCMECHGSVPKVPILGARLGYDVSGHKTNGNSRYANGGGCQICHTNEGFIDFVANGNPAATAFVDYPSQPGCFTCHAPHETGTMELRTVAAVKLANGETFDAGSGNLCANCHKARVVAPKTAVPLAANAVSASWGSHHGPQADLLVGTNAYEFAGKKYASGVHGMVVKDSCVQCHLSQPSARYGFSPDVGGHSFNVVGEVHENELANTSGCVSCHKDIKQVPGKPYFNILARDDYDLDGAKEPVQLEVQGLLDKFVNKGGTGVLQTNTPPFYGPDGAWKATTAATVRPLSEMAALYNYKMILEDRSLGVHNSVYIVEVLYDSLQAMDPKFDASRRP